MKLSHSMGLSLAMSLGSMSLAQDLATDVGKRVKDTEKATKTVAKDTARGTGKQLKIRVIRPGHDEGCQENRDGALFVDKVEANEDTEDV